MKHRPTVISLMITGIVGCTAILWYAGLPYTNESLLLIVISLIILSLLSKSLLFLFTVIVVIGFGSFLTMVAFINQETEVQQVDFMYLHVLVTVILLQGWILMDMVKWLEIEHKRLSAKIMAVQKYKPNSSVLTIREFLEQGGRILRGTIRRKEQIWLLELRTLRKKEHSQKSYQQELEKIAKSSIREEYDIITSTNSSIFILLQNTQEKGVWVVRDRIEEKAKVVFNDVHHAFAFNETLITEMKQVEATLEEVTNG